jgi:hypothetical protein
VVASWRQRLGCGALIGVEDDAVGDGVVRGEGMHLAGVELDAADRAVAAVAEEPAISGGQHVEEGIRRPGEGGGRHDRQAPEGELAGAAGDECPAGEEGGAVNGALVCLQLVLGAGG